MEADSAMEAGEQVKEEPAVVKKVGKQVVV